MYLTLYAHKDKLEVSAKRKKKKQKRKENKKRRKKTNITLMLSVFVTMQITNDSGEKQQILDNQPKYKSNSAMFASRTTLIL